MTVAELAKALELTPAAGAEGMGREVTGGYCGDLLSWVMGRAQEGDAWITVMGNLNAVAVAVLADTACIILAEGVGLDEGTLKQAESEGIAVLTTELPVFDMALEVYEAGLS